MKKILSFILTATALMLVVSCSNSKTNSNSDTCCDHSAKTQNSDTCNDAAQMACGVAFDGAMNSIFMRTAKGDTVSFGYAELEPAKRVSWMIGDTVTIKYIKTPSGNDSVIQMYKGCITDCK